VYLLLLKGPPTDAELTTTPVADALSAPPVGNDCSLPSETES